MSWLSLLAVLPAFALGWFLGLWQCSRRRDCPRYSAYVLARWKRQIEKQCGDRRGGDDSPEPPEGRAA